MRNFVRNSNKGGFCNAFDQHYKSEVSDEIPNFSSKKRNVNGNICDLLEKFFKLLCNYGKLYAKDFDLKCDDYRDIKQKEKVDCINNKLKHVTNS